MSTTDAGIRQLKNGNWAYRFSISVNGQKISQRGSTNSEGQPLKTKTDAIRARKKAIKLAQLALLLPVKEKEPEKLTVAQVFDEYREKGRSDRAYNTILKQDSLWTNHLQEAFGHRILEEIEVAEVSDYLAKLYYEEEYSFRYVESFLKMFYLIFGQAYSRGYLSVDRYNCCATRWAMATSMSPRGITLLSPRLALMCYGRTWNNYDRTKYNFLQGGLHIQQVAFIFLQPGTKSVWFCSE